MNSQQAMKMLIPQFWLIGKSNGEQLWMHHYTVWYVFSKMLEMGALPSFDNKQAVFEVSCLLHDLKKYAPWNQLILSGESDINTIIDSYIAWWQGKGVTVDNKEKSIKKRLFESGHTDHQIETERDYDYFLRPYLEFVKNALPFELTKDKSRMIFDIVKHHFLKEEDISKAELPGFGNFIIILKLCDRLASMETVDVNTIDQLRSINKLGRQIFDVTYFTISRKFGPTTALVLDKVFEHYKKCYWTPLLYFEDGGVLIAKGKGQIPDKKAILKDTFSTFLTKSLEILPAQYGRKTMLTGVAADHPRSFITAHQDEITRQLNESNAGVTFFKFLIEILDNAGYNNKKVRTDYPALDILFGLTTGTRGISLANKKWQKYKKESLPLKEDKSGIDKRSSLNHIFNSIDDEEVIPQHDNKKAIVKSKPLREFSSKELFNVLLNITEHCEKETDRDHKITNYIDEIIAMEEEKDFSAIAKARFEQYKVYKSKPINEKVGICEICGSTVIQKPGADFAAGQIQAFSQIKARPDVPRKICPFCAYDNSVMRQDIGNWIPIYVKVSSRIPLEFRQELSEKIIKPLKDGVIRIQSIENMKKRWGIFFPDVPILVGESNYDLIEYVLTTDKTEIVTRLELIDPKEFSPKDQKAKYEPLYHLLSLLGFKVNIGAEEQIGLFGETILTSEQYYFKSLATILLSSTLFYMQKGKRSYKNRRYIIAKELLDKSPSVAISQACQEYKDKSGNNQLKMSQEIASRFFEYLYKSGIALFSIEGGEYKMKNLLQDAAFFSEGIPKFCWKNEDEWKKWNEALKQKKTPSKHLINKPLSQTLNEILQGRDFDEAFARFLSNIREDIAKDKEKSDKATTDVKEMEEFVRIAKEKFMKFYELKKKSITEFIRVKNALLSAVYVFKRYENLKEVCK